MSTAAPTFNQLRAQAEESRRRRVLDSELYAIDGDHTITPMERALLRELVYIQMGHAGRERVKRAQLAARLGIHPLSVPRIARRLERAGRIVRVPCFDRGGRQSGNQWALGPVGPGGVTRTRQKAPRSWQGEPSELPPYSQRERARRPRDPRRAPGRARGNPERYPLRARAASPLRGGAGTATAAPTPPATSNATSQSGIGRAHPAQGTNPAASGRGGPTPPGRSGSTTEPSPQAWPASTDPTIAALVERGAAACRRREGDR